MNYELKHFNTTLVCFSATEDTAAPDINILWVNEECRDLLPLGMELSGSGIAKWLKQRTIPKNRAYVNSFLSKCGLHINRPMNIIRVSKALIAFTGYGSSVRTSLVSCPEFTTNGMLPKCWRRVNGTIRLYKGGTSGASNTGCEPYSEYYAAQIAEVMGINSVSYNLSKWKGELCSVCDLFTSKDYSYLPVGRMVTAGGMEAVREYYQSLGKEYIDALNAMLVFDAVIFNTDRHFGNFGFMVNNKTNKITASAPLFDHGNALFNYAGRDDLETFAALEAYAATLMPCTYDDFTGTAKKALTPELREGLRHLLDFKFKKHPRYNLPDKRLKLLEQFVQKQARVLLEK